LSFITKKYRDSFSFYREQAFFGKTEGYPLWILSQNLKKIKTQKNLYTGALFVTDTEFELYDQEIWSFRQF
jgi:hypothetical protein